MRVRGARPEPMLRSIPEPVRVGALIAAALAASAGIAARPLVAEVAAAGPSVSTLDPLIN